MRNIISAAAIFFLVLTAKNAGASCGSANCFLVTGTLEGMTEPGQMTIDLSYRWIPQDQVYQGSKGASEAVVPAIDFKNGAIEPGHHREIRTNNELAQMDLSYGITPKFTLTLSAPFFNLRTHEHEHIPGEFSRQDGSSGFGDLRLIGRYLLLVRTKHILVSGVGIKTPTGEYKLMDSEGAINEPTVMPGTGSWDGIVSGYYAYQILLHQLDTFFSGSYQINTENNLKYKFGNTLVLNGGVNYLRGRFTTSLQINLRQAPHDRFRGTEVPSTGGEWIYLTPGLRVEASARTMLYSHVQLPVYQSVNEVNLVPRYGLIFGVSHTF